LIAFRTFKAESHYVELDVRHLQKRGPFGQLRVKARTQKISNTKTVLILIKLASMKSSFEYVLVRRNGVNEKLFQLTTKPVLNPRALIWEKNIEIKVG